jgi:alpha-glucosidase
VADKDWWRGGGDLSDLPALLQDTNGDGVGDLIGIIRAPANTWPSLGVDAIWISPFFPRR